MRIGFGYDVHRLVEGRDLVLGGVPIPYEKGLDGHSDADVLLHAVTDALLGAAALGDIGTHFPDTDERFRGADSVDLLTETVRLLAEAGYTAFNIDSTVVAEQPRLQQFVGPMRGRIAQILELGPGSVSVKATTSEGMGFIGAGEGIAAFAVCTISNIDDSDVG